jgi:hypothetical protein
MNFNSVFAPEPKISDIVTSKERRREFKAKKREAKFLQQQKLDVKDLAKQYGTDEQAIYDYDRGLRVIELLYICGAPKDTEDHNLLDKYFVEQGLLEPRIIFE